MKNSEKNYKAPAVERAFEILDLIKLSGYGRTASELSTALNLPYSTTFCL